jgi:energy-coupling factor transporter ATP-binding protein EcfA2
VTAIQQVSIRHFQSLVDVSLTLGNFTVIVGPSSSGKSAFVRALQTLTHNARGTAFITQGKPGCSITATLPTAIVTLTRSRSSSATDAYGVRTDENDQRRYTKLGGSTPPEVTSVFGQMADPSAIASQFDPPYLLTQSPAEAARTLAALTGSDVVLEGAREANRRRLEATATLRTRSSDKAKAEQELASHAQHASQSAHLDSAEPHLTDAKALLHQCAALQGLLDHISADSTGIQIHREALASLPSIPDLAPLDTLSDSIRALRYSIANVTSRAYSVRDLKSTLDGLEVEIDHASERYDETLHALGVCPTCHQPV